MKRSISILAAVAACAITVTMCANMPPFSEKDTARPVVLSNTNSVPVPDRLEFAGEELEVSRYDIYERFDREINSFVYTHSTTMMLIKRANRFFPVIEPILARNGIPDDLKYMCVIESSLSPTAVSTAGAAGLWQFMKKTAPEFGLEVSEEVDERYAIEASTEAACKYLKQAYAKYNNWAAAILSFNAGQGRISKELDAQRVSDALDLFLVEESTRYYFRMLAVKQIFENPQRYGFFLLAEQLYKPMEFKRVQVSESIDNLVAFAASQGITYAQLKGANAWLRSNKLTIKAGSGKKYTLLIPTQESLYYDRGRKPTVHNSAWVVERLPDNMPATTDNRAQEV